jgi:23S rRNA (adenine2503-C2)-methyltransferase
MLFMDISEFVQINKLPKFRITQLYKAKYQEFIGSYNELTTWPMDLREEIKSAIPFSSIIPIKTLISQDSQTLKILLKRNSDGKIFETVLIKHADGRSTVCVSCMIGCPVGCTFCATGKMGFLANLTAEEITDQVLYMERLLKKDQQKVTNVVFMGMGEPMLNLIEVKKTIDCLTDPCRTGMSDRRITVSTSGITPNLKKFMEMGFTGRIALSLHAPNQTLREKLMPIGAKYPLPELLKLLSEYAYKTKKRISFEYALISKVNDSERQAHELSDLIGRKLTHVNLIPYNPVPGYPFEKSTPDAIGRFSQVLTKRGIKHTIRVTMGDDIKAACGQLAGGKIS